MNDVSHSGDVLVGIAQMAPRIAQAEANLERCLDLLKEARQKALDLVVFPECALTGYNFSDPEEALSIAPTLPGPLSEALIASCRRQDLYAVVGSLERADERLYNTALLIGPQGVVGKYRKTHLPYLGADRFAQPGDLGLPVFDTELGRIGMLICFDLRLPEPARVLALQGAEIIAIPTNWPQGAEANTLFITRARASENRVYIVAADRVGEERGTRFLGRSQIIDTTGGLMSKGSEDGEEWVSARLMPALARTKRLVARPGQYELDFWKARRPELYAAITSPLSAGEESNAKV